MKSEPGICLQCGKTEDCLNTSIGWMCRPCFHNALKNGSKPGERIYTLPEPGQKVFVVKEPPDTYITIGGILYAFDRKNDAEEIVSGLKRGYAIKAFVDEVEAMLPLRYVLKYPELRLVGVKEKIERKNDIGPDEIPVPRL